MRIYPAVHYTMGGLWVDYNLMSTIPGLHVIGEANFSDHGANRLGASALMQGLADGYFVISSTIGDYLSKEIRTTIDANDDAFAEAESETHARLQSLLDNRGKQTAESLYRRLGRLMWDVCGMSRSAEALQNGIGQVKALREEFWNDVFVPGRQDEFNPELEKATRVADFMELGELMMHDALHRNESCGGHFREEYQTQDGEALRNDADFAYVAAWDWNNGQPKMYKEPLEFKDVEMKTRSYK
jgi:succinate dehydrogenase / fumarate reductase flavoprotein subunit